MKSFPVTKEMRADIAQQLTSQAVKAEVDAIDKEAAAINKTFWKQYESKLRAASGVPSTRWATLITIGMAKTVLEIFPRKKRGEDKRSEPAAIIPMNRIGLETLERQITSSINSKLFRWFGHRFDYDLRLKLTAPRTMPDMNRSEMIEDEDLLDRCLDLEVRTEKLIFSIGTVHQQTMSVLSACRTSKQMQDLFPDGAALLPVPEEKQELAPVELAESVTKMIRQGVPPVIEES